METIGLEALRRELSRIIGRVYYGREVFIVEVYGKPAAALLNIADFHRLRALESLATERVLSLSEALGIIQEEVSLAPWAASTREAVEKMLERRARAGVSPVTAAELVAEGRAGRGAACGR